jgi:hypothetical protein
LKEPNAGVTTCNQNLEANFQKEIRNKRGQKIFELISKIRQEICISLKNEYNKIRLQILICKNEIPNIRVSIL